MKPKTALPYGIYEKILNKEVSDGLASIPENEKLLEKIDAEEAAKILSQYLSEVIEHGLVNIKESNKGIQAQIKLCNELIQHIEHVTGTSYFGGLEIDQQAKLLFALVNRHNSVNALQESKEVVRPATSIASSSLFTGALHEPSMYSELKKEILSCDRIDMLVSFIKWSGLRLIIEELKEFTCRGKLRVITTSYMGATDPKAIEILSQLPNTEIKISYDTKRTRLHAKTYVFHRDTGYTTAYVGSSNLSNAAISSGLEWNVKVTAKDMTETLEKINATFESYWNSSEFSIYSSEKKMYFLQAIKAEQRSKSEQSMFHFEIYPFPYQQEILERLDAERRIKGHFRNLVVAATGTGKTVISAFDYRQFAIKNKRSNCRLLFVAHREEILKQSLACFRTVMKDSNFGDLFVGGYTPEKLEHLFISIQTFNSRELYKITSEDFYDFIIVDEFHHAAANSYQQLLEYYKPQILLGLTATPERMDGRDVLSYFENRVAAEIRLPEAIDRKLLCPFHYFGVTDSVKLDSLRWSRRGYDKGDLDKLLTGNDIRASLVISAINRYSTDIMEIKGLGFCVSVAHAEFMSNYFNRKGIASIHLTSKSEEEERDSAKERLLKGEIKFIFVVDLYNEGVDIPEVNTILFLRPTESLTVFLQQLGRGLRLADNKECLSVLDFIGQANRKYSFEDKFRALLSDSTKSIQKEVKEGFVSLPKGCFIQLEKVARKHILDNIRNAIGFKTSLISRISNFQEDTGQTLSLQSFVDYYHIELRKIYEKESFSRLCAIAKVRDDFFEQEEQLLQSAFPRISEINSLAWIEFMLDCLPKLERIQWSELTEIKRKYLTMLFYTIYQKEYPECGFDSYLEGLICLKKSPVMFRELQDLLEVCKERVDFVEEHVDLGFVNPLALHCAYSRDQILVGLGFMKPNTVREGVKFLEDKGIDVFFITLNKSEKDYSPSTLYKDYSESEYLFHWQSQSQTAENSRTGQRYIHHKQMGTKVLLFVRDYKKDTAGALPYTFLGLADYEHHYGERPMSIIWKLHKPIPARFIKKTNKLIG